MYKPTDQIKLNTFLNAFEIKKGLVKLSSYPRNVGIGTHFFCNAKCVFCLGGKYNNFCLERYKNFFEEKLYHVFRKAESIDFHGYGEFLLSPEINSFLKYVNKKLPEQTKSFFTNGIALKNIKFYDGKYNLIISLHASNKELHKQITGVNCFDYIIKNIKETVKLKNVRLTLYSVLNVLNINDMCDFIVLANKLKIKNIIFKYMTIFNKDHFKLSVFIDRKNANKNIIAAEKLASKLGINVELPCKFYDISNSFARCRCMQPWNNIYIENQGTVNSCCFAGTNIGNINNTSFENIWNSNKYQKLRNNILNDTPDAVCKKCMEYNPCNVDKLSSHITFRPYEYKKLLEYITKNMNSYSLSINDII